MFYLIKKIKQDRVLKSLFFLVSGTGIAHLLTFVTLPLLTRFYNPEQFGVLASYIALVSILSSIACLRLEIAIPLPRLRIIALGLLVNAIFFSLIVSFVSLILVLVFSPFLTDKLTLNLGWLLLIPFGVFFASLYNVFQYWFTREKKFSLIAKTKVSQSVSCNSTQIVGGILGIYNGLILGHFLFCIAGVFSLSKAFFKNEIRRLKTLKFKVLKLAFHRYKQYPTYSTLEVFANNAGTHLPILLITAFSVAEEAGFLLLAMRVLQAPMALLGTSISQVFYAEISSEKDGNQQKEIVHKAVNNLVKVGVGPIIFFGVIAYPLFTVLFGEEWGRAGTLVSWCVGWFAFQFISSPISMVMHVKNKQKQILFLTIFGCIVRTAPVAICVFYEVGFISEVYAFASGVFYCVCFLVFALYGGLTLDSILRVFKSNIWVLVSWFLSACACFYMIKIWSSW